MKIYIFLFWQFLVIKLFSQNLINNGGFEIYKKCPDNLAQIKYATGWQDQNGGNGDYFNVCSKNPLVTVPGNRTMAHSGNGYAGICSIKQQYFEFIQTKLISPLDPEKTYCLELFVYKAPDKVITIDELALLFSQSENKTGTFTFYDDKLIKENNLISCKLPKNASEWTAVRLIYKPKAAEQFLTIGLNKLKNVSTELIQQPYYYIDDISLTELRKVRNATMSINFKIAGVQVKRILSNKKYSSFC